MRSLGFYYPSSRVNPLIQIQIIDGLLPSVRIPISSTQEHQADHQTPGATSHRARRLQPLKVNLVMSF